MFASGGSLVTSATLKDQGSFYGYDDNGGSDGSYEDFENYEEYETKEFYENNDEEEQEEVEMEILEDEDQDIIQSYYYSESSTYNDPTSTTTIQQQRRQEQTHEMIIPGLDGHLYSLIQYDRNRVIADTDTDTNTNTNTNTNTENPTGDANHMNYRLDELPINVRSIIDSPPTLSCHPQQ